MKIHHLKLCFFALFLLLGSLSLLNLVERDTPSPAVPNLGPVLPDTEPARTPPRKEKPGYTFEPGALPELAPFSADRYEYYAALATHLGAQPSGLTVIGLRGLDPNGRRHPSSDNATDYDDTFVVLDPSRRQVWEFLGSTHAGQTVSTLSPGGVAQIQPGFYRADPCGEFADMPCWLVTTRSGGERIPCWRDADGDGSISAAEMSNPTTATEILFHNGRYYDHGSSIGCQVMPPDLMETFIRVVGKSRSFDYLLVDANLPMNG